MESVEYTIDDYIDELKLLKLILNDGTIIESDSDTVDSEEENLMLLSYLHFVKRTFLVKNDY